MLTATESILKASGFQNSARCCARPSCFCLAARNNGNVTFIHVPRDLGNILFQDAFELSEISSFFSGTPLLICDHTREKPLENDTVYTRYHIYSVTPKTLEDIVMLGTLPLIEAEPGGYFARLDGEAIRNRRQELGLSVGKLAEQLGISRRTLYGYERDMAKASVSAAYNIEWILGIPIVKPIDIFKPFPSNQGFLAAAKRIIVRNRFLQTVLKKFISCRFKITPTSKAPFDFIAQNPKNHMKIIGGVSQEKERNIDQRTQEILSISEIVKAQPVFITDGKFVPNNIPLIHANELFDISFVENFFAGPYLV
jgi:putative transcriptional regulator